MTRLSAAVTTLALAVTVILGGCTQATPNTTAVVNGVVIHESTVDETADALVSTGAISTFAQARSSAFSALIGGEVARQVASADGITLTPADIAALSANNPTFVTFLTTPLGVQYATDQVNSTQVTNQVADWRAQFAAVKVDLNPRYGSWATLVAGNSSIGSTGSMSVISGS